MADLTIPAIGDYIRGTGRLVRVEPAQVIPSPPQKDYIFEDISARGELRLNGKVVKQFGTYSDLYGENTSVETALQDMKELVKREKIGPDSDLEVVVVKVISQTRMRAVPRVNIYARGYVDFESLSCGSKWRLPDDVETVVWSSKEVPHA